MLQLNQEMQKEEICMVSINQEKCIGCGKCVKDCFFGVLSLKENKAEVIPDKV